MSSEAPLLLSAFIVTLLAAALGAVEGIGLAATGRLAPLGIVAVGLSLLALAAAFAMRFIDSDAGGVAALATGVAFFIVRPETAGLLAFIGGLLAIVSGGRAHPRA